MKMDVFTAENGHLRPKFETIVNLHRSPTFAIDLWLLLVVQSSLRLDYAKQMWWLLVLPFSNAYRSVCQTIR